MKNLHGTGKKESQPQDTRDFKKWKEQTRVMSCENFTVNICKHASAASNTYVVLLSSKPTNKACLLGIGTVSNVACGKTRPLKLANVSTIASPISPPPHV